MHLLRNALLGLVLASMLMGCETSQGIPYSESIENVIIIAIDTVRASHLGFMGYPRRTSPFMDEYAERSVVFTNAYCTKSLTLPSFVCLFSGLHTIHNGIFKNLWPIADDLTWLVEDFQSAGFKTMFFSASDILHSQYGISRGFDVFKDPDHHPQEFSFTRSVVAQELQTVDQPLFLVVHIWEPHVPYDPDPEVLKLFADPDYEGPMDASIKLLDAYTLHRVELNEADILHAVDRYDGELRGVDDQLRELFDFFDEKGLLDNSLIVFLADHGESLGEDHIFNHRRDREVELHIPLMFHFPGDLHAGRTIPALVENTDILPTIMDILEIPIPDGIDGMSLLPLITGEAVTHRDKLLSVGTNDTGRFLYSEYDGIARWRVDLDINPTTEGLGEQEIELLESLGYVQ